MKSYDVFGDLYFNYKKQEILECINVLLKIAVTTDNGYYDDVDDRFRLYFLMDNLLLVIDEVYLLGENWQNNYFRFRKETNEF